MMEDKKIKIFGDDCPIQLKPVSEGGKGHWFFIESWMNNGPCVYVLCTQKEIVYIGQSAFILQRIGTHTSGELRKKKKEFEMVYVIPAENEKQMNKLEEYLIKRHKPKYNVMGTGDVVRGNPFSPYKRQRIRTW